MAIYDPIVDAFSQDEVKPYKPDQSNFFYGGHAQGAEIAAGNQRDNAAGSRDQGEKWAGIGRTYRDQGNNYFGLGQSAQGRAAPQVDLTRANLSRSGANAALGQADAARAAQMGNAGAFRDFYQQGPGPSAAEAQLRMAQDRNAAQAIALARSGRGAGANAAASRAAMAQGAEIGQRTAAEMAALRAGEAATFRGQQLQAMGGEQAALAGVRGGDQSTAGMYSQLYGQDLGQAQFGANLAFQQGVQNDAFQTNMINAQNQAGQLQLGAGNLELGFGNQAMGYEQLGSNIMGQQLQANMGYEGMVSGNNMAAQMANAQFDQQRDGSNMMLAATGIGAMAAASDRDAKTNIEGGDSDLSQYLKSFEDSGNPALSGLAMGLKAGGSSGGSNGPAPKASAPPDPSLDINRNTSEFDVSYSPIKADPFVVPEYKPPTMPEQQDSGGMGQMLAMAGPMMSAASDKRAKRDIQSEAGRMVSKLEPYSFEYKDPARFGAGRRYGIMAQDLEKTPAGRSVVKQAPDGTKLVDTRSLTMLNTAAQAEQQNQIAQLRDEVQTLKRGRGMDLRKVSWR